MIEAKKKSAPTTISVEELKTLNNKLGPFSSSTWAQTWRQIFGQETKNIGGLFNNSISSFPIVKLLKRKKHPEKSFVYYVPYGEFTSSTATFKTHAPSGALFPINMKQLHSHFEKTINTNNNVNDAEIIVTFDEDKQFCCEEILITESRAGVRANVFVNFSAQIMENVLAVNNLEKSSETKTMLELAMETIDLLNDPYKETNLTDNKKLVIQNINKLSKIVCSCFYLLSTLFDALHQFFAKRLNQVASRELQCHRKRRRVPNPQIFSACSHIETNLETGARLPCHKRFP